MSSFSNPYKLEKLDITELRFQLHHRFISRGAALSKMFTKFVQSGKTMSTIIPPQAQQAGVLQLADLPDHTTIDILADLPVPKTPSLYLNRERYLKIGVSLYKYALKGDWESAEKILLMDRSLLSASISSASDTVLHVAAASRHIHFVKKLVELMDKEHLALQDKNGNNALCIAAAAGAVEIVEILIKEDYSLLTARGSHKMAPPYMAAVLGQSKMAWHLYAPSKKMMVKEDLENLFFSCVNNRLYDLALQLLKTDPSLAKARTDRPKDKTALHILARRPNIFGSQNPGIWGRLVRSRFNFAFKRNVSETDYALQLVTLLWEEILKDDHNEVLKLIKYPSNLIFDAAEIGNDEFLSVLLSLYPELVWETDDKNRTIIHVAVLRRHANIFTLVHEIGSIKDIILTYEDEEGNNIVHMAAKVAPESQLNQISGVAIQMQRELVWFEEVKKIVQPQYIEMENNEGKTPQELFTEEHKTLMRHGEKWMKVTASSCLLVATIIATVVFSAAFSIPGGTDDKTGKPNFVNERAFLYYSIADGVALFSSSTAMLMFLFILTSRYAEKDFLMSLPLKLMVGLTCLFISIASMMMAFSTAFYLSCHYGSKWVPDLTFCFAFVPVVLYLFLQFPLVVDISSSTFCSSLLFQPWKRMIY